jgi:hypothetical protein
VETRQRLEPRLVLHQVQQRRALAAGQHDAGEALKLRAAAHLAHVGAGPPERGRVRREVSLQREDAEAAHQPRA